MTAMESLLTDLIDYAGLYPPAGLDMSRAVRNYLAYRKGEHAAALGRFVVNLDAIPELCQVAGDSLGELRVSVVAPAGADWNMLKRFLEDGVAIHALEVRINNPKLIDHISKNIPTGLMTYIEVPFDDGVVETLDAISASGMRGKLRMGGVVAEAFPPTSAIAEMLKAMVVRNIPFKATAGLHHPIRAAYRLTNEADGPSGMMHGFLNLFCAAALLYFGEQEFDAQRLLEERDPASLCVTERDISWRGYHWNVDQICEVRRACMMSIGSCSFEEPIRDLGALGWR